MDTTNNIMSHIEIQEEDKDNQFSLGKKLRIDDEEFEDLDEVIARYVDPMVSNELQQLTINCLFNLALYIYNNQLNYL